VLPTRRFVSHFSLFTFSRLSSFLLAIPSSGFSLFFGATSSEDFHSCRTSWQLVSQITNLRYIPLASLPQDFPNLSSLITNHFPPICRATKNQHQTGSYKKIKIFIDIIILTIIKTSVETITREVFMNNKVPNIRIIIKITVSGIRLDIFPGGI
jgi:hypothetical protein